MAIPQDGLGAEQVQQLEAYEATAKLVQDPGLAAYLDVAALKQTMEEVLGSVFDGGCSTHAADHAKLTEFVEAVKTEASAHGLSAVEAKVQAELAKIGAAGTAGGAGTGAGGDGAGPEPAPEPSSSEPEHDDESNEQETGEPEHHHEDTSEPEHHEDSSDEDSDDGSGDGVG